MVSVENLHTVWVRKQTELYNTKELIQRLAHTWHNLRLLFHILLEIPIFSITCMDTKATSFLLSIQEGEVNELHQRSLILKKQHTRECAYIHD
jgi:hypothetical protein